MRKIALLAGWVAVLLVSAATTVAAVRPGPGVAAASVRRVGLEIMVPAYWYQGTPSWKTLATMHNPRSWHGGSSSVTVSEAIFNPCAPDGKTCSPGAAPNPATRRDLRAAQANKVTFYGYVWTGYGRVPAGTVRKEIREYGSWYGLRGIFLDGASTNCARESSYYLPLYRYVHSRHGKVILNPGTQPPACYLRAADQISVFEGTGAQFAAYAPPAQGRWPRRSLRPGSATISGTCTSPIRPCPIHTRNCLLTGKKKSPRSASHTPSNLQPGRARDERAWEKSFTLAQLLVYKNVASTGLRYQILDNGNWTNPADIRPEAARRPQPRLLNQHPAGLCLG